MTYRLMLQDPIVAGVCRVGLEQIEIAETKLASGNDVPAAIHDTRRCLKRLRALLHLVRPGLDETAYRREAKQLAAIGRLLSGARDQHVMLQTLAKLSQAGPLPKSAAARLRRLIASGRARNGRQARTDGRAAALVRLKRARKLFTGKAIEDLELGHLVDGLEITYAKARKAMRKAYAKPSDETFHSWRKSTQRHWRHMQLLSPAWPEALMARAGEAKELSRLLGEDHDYAVLVAFAEKRGKSAAGAGDLAALVDLCRSHQQELRALAKLRGERLFAEGDESFKHRIALYWSSATALCGLTADGKPEVKKAAPTRKARRVRRRPPKTAAAPAVAKSGLAKHA
jgi:CHAD domain-containing protein